MSVKFRKGRRWTKDHELFLTELAEIGQEDGKHTAAEIEMAALENEEPLMKPDADGVGQRICRNGGHRVLGLLDQEKRRWERRKEPLRLIALRKRLRMEIPVVRRFLNRLERRFWKLACSLPAVRDKMRSMDRLLGRLENVVLAKTGCGDLPEVPRRLYLKQLKDAENRVEVLLRGVRAELEVHGQGQNPRELEKQQARMRAAGGA